MSGTLGLMKYTGDNRKIDKGTYSTGAGSPWITKSYDTYKPCSLHSPTVTIDFDSTVLSNGYNYAYIKEYSRYYYITDMVADSAKRITLHLAIDVLNTYKTGIMSAPCNIIRSESAGINYTVDDMLPLDSLRYKLTYGKQLALPSSLDPNVDDTTYNYLIGIYSAQS